MVTVPATPVVVTVDDIVAAEGPRVPDAASSPREFHMAFLVLVLSDDVADDVVLDQIDDVRTRFETEWEEDVGGRADLVTSLGSSTAPEWGAPAEDTGTSADTDSGADATEEPAGDEADCGCAAAPASNAGLAALLVGLAALTRRRRV